MIVLFIEQKKEVSMDFNDAYFFLKILKYGSFTKASEALGVQKSKLSRRMTSLEESLQVRLLNRTTRTLSLTEEGQAFYERIEPLIEGLEDAKDLVQSLHYEPQGKLRITSVIALGQFVSAEIIPQFLKLYPKINIELNLSTIKDDIISENYDLALRPAPLIEENSNLISKKVGTGKFVLVGNDEWLEKFQKATTLEEINNFPWIINSHALKKSKGAFQFTKDDVTVELRPKNIRLSVNNLTIIRNAVVQGLGIGYVPSFMFTDDIQKGTLKVLVKEYKGEEVPLYALYPSRDYLSPKTKAFLDFLEDKKDLFK